jgi:hypothetical protein
VQDINWGYFGLPNLTQAGRGAASIHFDRALALLSRFASLHNFTATASSFTESVIHPHALHSNPWEASGGSF